MSGDWQPIETAPKNGAPIILYVHEMEAYCGPKQQVIAYWNGKHWSSTFCVDNWSFAEEPTHWRPLSPDPEIEEDET